MAKEEWRIDGIELANCNCNYGCPCQFNAMPTKNQCEAVWAMRIDKGQVGKTRLDGLAWGFLVWWPGAVHEGNGKMQVFGEERATPEQRKALESIATGKISEEGTYFQIFSAMAPNLQPSVWKPVTFQLDIEKRTGKLEVKGLVDTKIEPIRNPMTQQEHRVSVNLPNGFEYKKAEYASGTTKATGPIPLNFTGSHTHVAKVGWDARNCYGG
jgi:hypothetical protein